jgi:hypothetical protein
LQILAARGIRIPTTVKNLLLAERNEAVVDRWVRCAGSCASVDELLGK